MAQTTSSRPILWDLTDEDVMQELSMLEYHYGCRRVTKENGKETNSEPMTNPYEPHERATALMASALLRIMKKQVEIYELLEKIASK